MHFGGAPIQRRNGFIGLAAYSLLALLPALVQLLQSDIPRGNALTSFAYSIALWAFWLAFWGRPWRGCVIALPLVLLSPIAVYLEFAFHAQLNPALIGIVLETNREESKEFLSTVWLKIVFSYLVVLAVVVLSIGSMYRCRTGWALRWRICTLLLVPGIFLALHLAYQPLESAGAFLHDAPNPLRTTVWPLEVENIRLTSPFGVILQGSDAIEAEHLIGRASDLLKTFRFGASQAEEVPNAQIFVLVIGESARKDRWALNGYDRATSPNLKREAGLTTFGDVVTVFPATRVAVPVIVTRKPFSQALDTGFRERSLVSAFREAGFATYWISTQAPVGPYDSTFAVYANEADHTAYYNVTGGWERSPPDGVMIDPLKKILANSSERRQLVVMHTLGSHIDYRFRYPDEFDVFKPSLARSDIAAIHDAAYKQKLNNAYDNSILYSDYFLSQVIDAVKASGRPLATVLYVSDHGEDLYDGGCDLWAHGKPTVAGYRVPMFFWHSDSYGKMFPQKIDMLNAHSRLPITTESVFPLVIDAADIRIPSEAASRSLMSPSFTPPSRRIVQTLTGTLDFDRAHPNAQCLLVQ